MKSGLDVIRDPHRFVFILLTLLSAGLAACGGDGSSTALIQLTATAGQTTLLAGQSTQITATELNDLTGKGVVWNVSCSQADCGSLSGLTLGASSGLSSATYTAPQAAPPADLTVTITATAQAAPSVSASVKITVSSTALSLSLTSGTIVPAGSSTPITAALVNDGNNAGIKWSVSCATAPCGSVSPLATASGAPATYTAPPATPAADLTVTLTATSTGSPVLSASVSITVPAIAVMVSPAGPLNMTAGTTQQLTATVSYDPANKGVTWTLQCSAPDCGAVSSLASASGQPVTYKAPTTPPPVDLGVTLTAQSVSAPAVHRSALITVKAVAVAITPISALVPLAITQQFVANVGFDPSASGVSWQLLQAGTPCTSACGTIAPLMTSSGAPLTYTAPTSLPANTGVTLKATSVTESSSSVMGTVIVTNGSVELAPVDMSFFKVSHGGPTPPRSPPPQTATMTNTGHAALTISNISIGGTGATRFSQTNTCGSGLAPGAS
jgi:hypothetical protein